MGGGAELALMSTSPRRGVASGYAGVSDEAKKLPTVFEFSVGKMSIGADVSELSQFEGEKEMLYPPLTRMESTDEPRLSADKRVSLIRMRLTINRRSKTIEHALHERRHALEVTRRVEVGMKKQ